MIDTMQSREEMLRSMQPRRILACGCVLGHERCFDCRPGLHLDQEKALAMSLREFDAPRALGQGEDGK